MNRLLALAGLLFVFSGCRRHYPQVESFELAEGGGCATLEDTTRYCWGSESPDRSEKPVVTPAAVQNGAPSGQERFVLSGSEWCDRSVTPPACETLPVAPLSFAAGPHHSCVAMPDGAVRCRGEADRGRLGRGAVGLVLASRVVAGVEGAKAVAVGDHFSCALLKNLTISCWGDNARHSLAQPGAVVHEEPVPVVGLFAVKKLGARGDQACASLTDGGLRCWGSVRGEPKMVSMGRPGTVNTVPMPVQFP